jgi:hypothetical protein
VSDLHWVGREVRAEQRRRRLGEDAACVLCGQRDLAALRKASRQLVEFHHLAGRANDAELGIHLCLTHHAILTERMRDEGVRLDDSDERVFLERLQAIMVGIGLALIMIGEALLERARDLGVEIARLDRPKRGWHEPPADA